MQKMACRYSWYGGNFHDLCGDRYAIVKEKAQCQNQHLIFRLIRIEVLTKSEFEFTKWKIFGKKCKNSCVFEKNA